MDRERVPRVEDNGDTYYFDKPFDGLGCVGPVACGRKGCTFGVYSLLEEQAEGRGYNPGCETCGAIGWSLVDALTNDSDGELPDDFKMAAAIELASRNNLSHQPAGHPDIPRTKSTLMSRLLASGNMEAFDAIIRWARLANDRRASDKEGG